jgi:hypothetical protein
MKDPLLGEDRVQQRTGHSKRKQPWTGAGGWMLIAGAAAAALLWTTARFLPQKYDWGSSWTTFNDLETSFESNSDDLKAEQITVLLNTVLLSEQSLTAARNHAATNDPSPEQLAANWFDGKRSFYSSPGYSSQSVSLDSALCATDALVPEVLPVATQMCGAERRRRRRRRRRLLVGLWLSKNAIGTESVAR